MGGNESAIAAAFGITGPAALAFLMLNLFTPPCFAAIGAMSAELKSKKWLFAGIGLQIYVGYTVGFVTYFFGTLLTGGRFESAWMPIFGWGFVLLVSGIVALFVIRKNAQLKKETVKKIKTPEALGV